MYTLWGEAGEWGAVLLSPRMAFQRGHTQPEQDIGLTAAQHWTSVSDADPVLGGCCAACVV